jgi:hypothetical protein
MKTLIRLTLIFFLIAIVPAELDADGPHQPWKDGCRECFSDGYGGAACAEEQAAWGTPSWVCTGGSHCMTDGSGLTTCVPKCGSRCYSA